MIARQWAPHKSASRRRLLEHFAWEDLAAVPRRMRGAQARAARAEAATKLAELRRDIAQLEQLSGDQVAAEDDATRQLLEARRR